MVKIREEEVIVDGEGLVGGGGLGALQVFLQYSQYQYRFLHVVVRHVRRATSRHENSVYL
jgi:hypothetical protein